MKAVIYNGPWDMSVTELPKPEPKPGEVLLQMEAVGICGSDVHGFTGESGRRAPGMVMGHEAVGRVVAHGAGVTEPAIGCRVTVYNVLADVAPTPEEGDPSFLNKRVVGVNLGKCGAMAEFLAIPASNALPVPDGVESEVALLTEPVAVVAHGFHRLEAKNIKPNRVVIMGSGTIGLSALLVAREFGVGEAVILDMIPEKLQRAQSFGGKPVLIESDDSPNSVADKVQEAAGARPDLVVDAVGSKGSFAQGVAMVEEGGSVLLIGNLAKEVTLPLQDIVSNEITFVGTYGFDRKAFEAALTMVPKLNDQLATFIEGHCSLEETSEVMTRLAKGEQQALKVVIGI